MAKEGEILVALDIGTTKVCAAVGEVNAAGIDIIGVSTPPSKGIRSGVVVNIEATASAVEQAIEEAELMAGCEISRVYVGLAGGHVKGFNSHGVVAVKGGAVSDDDIFRVIDAAKAVAIPADREVMHVLVQEYILDGQGGIMDPLGMNGVRLECKVHIITGARSSAENVIKCAEKCKLHVDDIVLNQLSSSEAVLSEDEKEIGCVMVDIGGGTTDIAMWSKGRVVHTSVLSLGGNHLTQDIGVGLMVPMAEAERLKQKSGCALTSAVGENEVIQVPSVGGREARKLPRQVLAEIIQPRMEEIFSLVYRELEQSGVKDEMTGGIVLCGGTAMLDSGPELATQVMGMPVRRGLPRGVGGLSDVVRNPKYATAVGLLLYGVRYPDQMMFKLREGKKDSLKDRVINWFKAIV